MINKGEVKKREIQVVRGDILFMDLNGAIGSEQQRVRPCLVVQNDMGNKFSPVTIVLPIGHTGKEGFDPHVEIHAEDIIMGEKIDGFVFAEQIRAVDKIRAIKKPVARLSSEAMKKVDLAIKISLSIF